MCVLDIYSRASIQQINLQKSALSLSLEHTPSTTKARFQQNVMNDTWGYLLLRVKIRKIDLIRLKTKFENCCLLSKKSFFLKEGKFLLKVVVLSIPTYVMSCFKLPIT